MPPFEAPPLRTPFPQEATPTIFSRPWINWLQSITDAFNTPIISNAAPVTSASPGIAGQIAYDANFIYVATATNTWKRVAIATW